MYTCKALTTMPNNKNGVCFSLKNTKGVSIQGSLSSKHKSKTVQAVSLQYISVSNVEMGVFSTRR